MQSQQSINFLKVLPAKTRHVLSLPRMGFILLAFLALLIILSILKGLEKYQASQNLSQAEKQKIQIQAIYQDMVEKYPLFVSEVPLITQVQNLENQLREKRRNFNSLTNLVEKPTFSNYMLALASSTPEDLWIKKIYIEQASSNISLEGYALSPDLVSSLLKNLKSCKAFSRIKFTVFSIKAMKDKDYVSFLLGTEGIKPKT